MGKASTEAQKSNTFFRVQKVRCLGIIGIYSALPTYIFKT